MLGLVPTGCRCERQQCLCFCDHCSEIDDCMIYPLTLLCSSVHHCNRICKGTGRLFHGNP